jgi:pimeloyl-ACP methyl ester carboxylesterase
MLGAGAAVLAGWLAVGVGPQDARGPAQRLALSPCHLEGLPEEVRCGRLEVPEDRATPGGRTIPIHVAVLPARRRQAEPDPLFLLAGGPGQGARSYAALADRFFRQVRRRRDIVLVDLRGSGDSEPLDCPRPDDDLALFFQDPASAFDVSRCLAAQQADVRLYTGERQMADLDAVRAALGYERVNLWGGSYGTRSALHYARLFPERLRSVVLDGAAPYELKFPLSVAADAQRALDLLLADCAADPACHEAFPRLSQELADLLGRLAAGPVEASVLHPRTGERRDVTIRRDLFAEQLRVFLYTPLHASLVPLAVTEAARGDFGPFLAMALEGAAWSTDTMALGLTLSVLCSEDVPRIDPAEVEAATRGTFLGSANVEQWRQWCGAWRAGEPPARVDEVLPSAAPTLILSGLLDPATPPRWGEAMRRHFPASLHVVVPGAAHNVSFTGCVPDLIARFIERGGGDGLDASCVEATRRPPFVVAATGTAP